MMPALVQTAREGKHNSYLTDYDVLAPLQSFALSHGIGLVVVTHTNQKDVFTPYNVT
jgi:hypothetical protein